MTRARAHRSALLSFVCLPALVCLLAITSCRTASDPASNTPITDTVVSTVPPFKTKEPERYSATRTVTSFDAQGGKFIETWIIARDGLLRHEEPTSAQTRVVYLDSPGGRFILWPEGKVYAVVEGDSSSTLPGDEAEEGAEDSPDRLLHAEPGSGSFQPLGVDTVAGRSAAKFRVLVNVPGAENVKPAETLIWIDSVLNMPIRSEMRSPDGVLLIINELSDITLQPDKQLFEIPTGYEKIPFSALQKQLKPRGVNP